MTTPPTSATTHERSGTSGRTPRIVTDEPNRADRVFNLVTFWSGFSVLVLLTVVGAFLLMRSGDALGQTGVWAFLTRVEWRTDVMPQRIGVLGMLTGTVTVAVIAIVVAVPIGVLAALFITDYSSERLRRVLIGLVDMLAAVPSLLFGVWGFVLLSGQTVPLSRWLSDHLGFIPIFATDPAKDLTGSMFIAGMVVGIMVLPIITSVAREVFSQTPTGEKEAALALGSTRWGMIRTVVLPYGKGGVIGGSMLALGRALGETIAVALLLPQIPIVSGRVLEYGGSTVSGFIATHAGADSFTVSGLMAAGLVLFVITLATNMMASVIVSRSRSGVGVDL